MVMDRRYLDLARGFLGSAGGGQAGAGQGVGATPMLPVELPPRAPRGAGPGIPREPRLGGRGIQRTKERPAAAGAVAPPGGGQGSQVPYEAWRAMTREQRMEWARQRVQGMLGQTATYRARQGGWPGSPLPNMGLDTAWASEVPTGYVPTSPGVAQIWQGQAANQQAGAAAAQQQFGGPAPANLQWSPYSNSWVTAGEYAQQAAAAAQAR